MGKHRMNDKTLRKLEKEYSLGNIAKSGLLYLVIGIAMCLILFAFTSNSEISMFAFVAYVFCLFASIIRQLLTCYQVRRRLKQKEQ